MTQMVMVVQTASKSIKITKLIKLIIKLKGSRKSKNDVPENLDTYSSNGGHEENDYG